MVQQSKIVQTIVLLLSMPLSGMAIDIYVPSLPAISTYFNANFHLSQVSISVYLCGYAFIQFIIGNISDFIGRKIPYIAGIILFELTSILILLTTKNIYFLLIWRTIQGVAAGMIIVPVRAIFADIYSGKQYYKIANYATAAWAIGPIIAPIIGAYLQHYFNWHAAFYFLIVYSLIISTLFVLIIPETISVKKIFNIKHLIYNYGIIFQSPEFIAGCILQGLLYSIFILFSVVGPFLIQTELNYSVIVFGHIALVMGLAWFLGNMSNQLLINLSLQHKVAYCLAIMSMVIIVACILNLIYSLNIVLIVLTTAIILFFASIIYPNFFAKNTKIFPNLAGTASAVAGGFCFLTSATVGGLGTNLDTHSGMHLFLGYLSIILLLWVTYWIQLYCANSKKGLEDDNVSK